MSFHAWRMSRFHACGCLVTNTSLGAKHCGKRSWSTYHVMMGAIGRASLGLMAVNCCQRCKVSGCRPSPGVLQWVVSSSIGGSLHRKKCMGWVTSGWGSTCICFGETTVLEQRAVLIRCMAISSCRMDSRSCSQQAAWLLLAVAALGMSEVWCSFPGQAGENCRRALPSSSKSSESVTTSKAKPERTG